MKIRDKMKLKKPKKKVVIIVIVVIIVCVALFQCTRNAGSVDGMPEMVEKKDIVILIIAVSKAFQYLCGITVFCVYSGYGSSKVVVSISF